MNQHNPKLPDPDPTLPGPYNCPKDTVIEIPDKNELYPRLIGHFGKTQGDSITCGDLQSLTGFGAMSGGRIDLTGLEYAINLEGLAFANVQPADLSPLKGLKKLKHLEISVDAIPLPHGFDCDEGGFWTLAGLDTLASLSSLETLILQGRSIQDLSNLADLKNLKYLNLRCNLIEDLSPLASLTQLESLALGGNRIADLSPLAKLTRLSWLTIDRNCPESLEPLSGLSILETLVISGDSDRYCPLENFEPLKKLSNLKHVEIINTNFSDMSLLFEFPNLEFFDLSQNNITDIDPLAEILEKGLPRQNADWPPTINLLGNNIKNLETFAQSLPAFKPDSYALVLAYNCLAQSQAENLQQLIAKGISLTYVEDQKPECFMRMILHSTTEPTFYWP